MTAHPRRRTPREMLADAPHRLRSRAVPGIHGLNRHRTTGNS